MVRLNFKQILTEEKMETIMNGENHILAIYGHDMAQNVSDCMKPLYFDTT